MCTETHAHVNYREILFQIQVILLEMASIFIGFFLSFWYHFLLQGTHCIISQLLCNYVAKTM